MRLVIRVLVMLSASGHLLGAFAQDTTTRSGFAIVTLTSGNIAGLTATESLQRTTIGGVQQAIVGPSPLITTASILVPVGPLGENTTSLSLTNPSLGRGGVDLILTDRIGNVVLNVVVQLGPHGHFSRFLNELFPIEPSGFSTPLLLTISSEIPIAILALNFRDGDFASIPLSSLSPPTPVPIQQLARTRAGVGANPGFGLGLPPVIQPSPGVSPPITVTSSPAPTTDSIGGSASLIFAEVVMGGEWSTEIAVGNTSAGTQRIRIDFFGPDGVNTSTLRDILIPSRGVFFVSTDPQAQPVNQ